jgi:hypothetical protein
MSSGARYALHEWHRLWPMWPSLTGGARILARDGDVCRRPRSAARLCTIALYLGLAHTPRDYMQQRVSRLHCSTSNRPGQCAHFHCTLWTEWRRIGARVGTPRTDRLVMYAMLGLGGFAISFALPKSHRQTCVAHSRSARVRTYRRISSHSTALGHVRPDLFGPAGPPFAPFAGGTPTSGSMRPYSVLNLVLERLRAGQCLMCLRID